MIKENVTISIIDFIDWDEADHQLSIIADKKGFKLTDILLWAFADVVDFFWHNELVTIPAGSKIAVCWEGEQCN